MRAENALNSGVMSTVGVVYVEVALPVVQEFSSVVVLVLVATLELLLDDDDEEELEWLVEDAAELED